MRHFGRRPLGSATSLPGMLNLGMRQESEEALEKENGSDKEKEPEKKLEGEGYKSTVKAWLTLTA